MFFFSSDTHFGDELIIKQDLRPFKNAKHFNRFVIKTWNKQACKNDIIFILGDFIDCDGQGFEGWRDGLLLVKKLKANVILILGNNEKRVIKYYFDNDFDKFKDYCVALGFKDVQENMIIQMRSQEFYLTHKPKNYNPKYINLFGHMHMSGGLYKPFGLNVGCDLAHFRLFSENDIFHFLEKKKLFWDKDENLNMKV